jgi:DNA-binding CsgD family transcriptional regulator
MRRPDAIRFERGHAAAPATAAISRFDSITLEDAVGVPAARCDIRRILRGRREAVYNRRMEAVATCDVRKLLDVVDALEYDPRRRAFTPVGLAALCELLGADWVTYFDRAAGAPRDTVEVEVGTRPFTGHNDALEAFLDAHRHELALLYTSTPTDEVILACDVASERAWRRTALYNEWYRETHIEPAARVVLTGPGAPLRSALMIDLADDAGRTFGERERTLLRLVRPWLVRPIELADTARKRYRAFGLRPRELDVLSLVREGLTNGEIAARLVISPATVRKHLENAFPKIGAHTRTEAIARLGEVRAPLRIDPTDAGEWCSHVWWQFDGYARSPW